MSRRSFYNTESQYVLHPAAEIVDMDSFHDGAIMSISDEHIEHCDAARHDERRMLAVNRQAGEAVGLYLIGTRGGQWSSSHHVESWVKTKKDNPGANLLVLRRALSASLSPSGRGCAIIQTTPVHHLELFSEVRIFSNATHPFSTNYVQRDKQAEGAVHRETLEDQRSDSDDPRRRLYTSNVDYPLIDCSDPDEFVNNGPWTFSGNLGQTKYHLGATLGCAQYNAEIASFNMNYNPQTKRAAVQISIDDSIRCKNSYAYLGANFLVYFEYNSRHTRMPTFGFETKLTGAAGFNVDLFIRDPSLSGSKTLTLLNPSPSDVYSLEIGSGLTLQYGFGGLKATLSGSGSAAGTAEFGTGASLKAVLGVMYLSDSGFKRINNASFTYTPPHVESTGFRLNSYALSVALTGIEIFHLTYSGYIGANFEATLTGVLSFSSSGTDSITIAIGAPTYFGSSRRRRLSSINATQALPVFYPGDAVPLVLGYSSFNPNEQTELGLWLSLDPRTLLAGGVHLAASSPRPLLLRTRLILHDSTHCPKIWCDQVSLYVTTSSRRAFHSVVTA